MGYSAEKESLEALQSELSTILNNSNTYLRNKGVSAASNMSGISAQINKIQTGKASNSGSVSGSGSVGGSITITHNLGVTPSYIILTRSTPSSSDGNPVWFSFNTYAVSYYSSFSSKSTLSISKNATSVTLTPGAGGRFNGTYTWYAIA